MECYVDNCFKKLSTNKLYFWHLRHVHGIKSADNFKCSECAKRYYDVRPFKLHLLNRHSEIFQPENLSDEHLASNESDEHLFSNENEEFSLVDETFVSEETLVGEETSVSEETLVGEETFVSEETLFNDFNANILKFLLNMHNNDNFTRKDVSDILKNVMHMIVDPILKLFKNVSKRILIHNFKWINEFYIVIEKTSS